MKIKRTPQILVDEDEFIPWAGTTRGGMIDEIYAHEKKTGKDKDPMSFTNTMERIGKMMLKYEVERLTAPVKCWKCGKDTIAMMVGFDGCIGGCRRKRKRP